MAKKYKYTDGEMRKEYKKIKKNDLFSHISEKQAEEIINRAQRYDLGRGDILFSAGDPGGELFIIISGIIKILRDHGGGRQSLLAMLGESDLIGELTLFDPGERNATAQAISNSVLLGIKHEELSGIIDSDPIFARYMLRSLTERLRETDNAISSLILSDVPGRLAARLVSFGDKFGSEDPDTKIISINHRLTQLELSQLVGSSRETINKTLAEFTARGWVKFDTHLIQILDREGLLQRAG